MRCCNTTMKSWTCAEYELHECQVCGQMAIVKNTGIRADDKIILFDQKDFTFLSLHSRIKIGFIDEIKQKQVK